MALPKGVTLDCIEASGHYDCIWLKSFNERAEHVPHDMGDISIPKALVQGHVDIVPAGICFASILKESSAWEETLGITVHAEEEDCRILRKDVVSAIAMVHVPVHDSHAPKPVALLQVPGGDRRIVEEAKPRGTVSCGMVAWWTHDRHACTNR